jgi:hypothetical protein
VAPAPAPNLQEDLKKDLQLQRAVDLLKAVRILDQRPAAQVPEAQAR